MSPDSGDEMAGPGAHPLVGRQRWLVRALRVGAFIAAALALGGLVVPGEAGEALAVGFLAVLIAGPILRVAWLAVRWVRRGDVRFALVSATLLLVVGAAVVLALRG